MKRNLAGSKFQTRNLVKTGSGTPLCIARLYAAYPSDTTTSKHCFSTPTPSVILRLEFEFPKSGLVLIQSDGAANMDLSESFHRQKSLLPPKLGKPPLRGNKLFKNATTLLEKVYCSCKFFSWHIFFALYLRKKRPIGSIFLPAYFHTYFHRLFPTNQKVDNESNDYNEHYRSLRIGYKGVSWNY
jgi:hypothetical protein